MVGVGKKVIEIWAIFRIGTAENDVKFDNCTFKYQARLVNVTNKKTGETELVPNPNEFVHISITLLPTPTIFWHIWAI